MWYYSKDNQQMGPVAEEQLKTLLRTSALSASSLVWKEGMADWKPVTEIPELAVALTTMPPRSGLVIPPTPPSANPYSSPASQINRTYGNQPMVGQAINGGGILAFAIFSTVMCCLPTGVAGIVYAAQINSKLAMGDFLGAAESARLSKMWSWIGFGLVGAFFLFYLIVGAITGFSNM